MGGSFSSLPQYTSSFHFYPSQPDFDAINQLKGSNNDIFRGHFIANFGNQDDYIGDFKKKGRK
jgi:hypothetical protein